MGTLTEVTGDLKMDALVPPTATHPGFVVNDESHGRRGHHDNSGHYAILHEVADGTRSILSDIGDNSRAVLHEVADGSRDVSQTVGANGSETRNSILHSGTETRADLHAAREALAATQNTILASVGAGFGETRLGVERVGGEIRRDVMLEGQNIKMLTSDRFAALDKFLCDKFGESTRDVLTGFSQAQLFAAQNAAKLSAELAECCCEVKELVRAEAGTTRELLRDSETQRLRDALAAANQQILVSQLSGNGNGNGNNLRA